MNKGAVAVAAVASAAALQAAAVAAAPQEEVTSRGFQLE